MKRVQWERIAKIDLIVNIFLIIGGFIYNKNIALFLAEKMNTPTDSAEFGYVLGILSFWAISEIIYLVMRHRKKDSNILRSLVFISSAGKTVVALVLFIIGLAAIFYDGPRTNLLMWIN